MSTITSPQHEAVSKLDAATRQLHLAIRLFFFDDDPIGVHTLAGAAHGILCGLVSHIGHRRLRIRSSSQDRATRRIVEIRIAEAKNFLMGIPKLKNS
jgi:hypothetical protein